MINYIKSELYRTLHNKGLHLFTGIIALIILAGIILVKTFASDGTSMNTNFVLEILLTSFSSFLFLLFSYIYTVEGDESKTHTLKNSISFGLSRVKIYLGKEVTGIIVSALAYVGISLFLICTLYLFLEHGDIKYLNEYIKASIVFIPLFIATLSIGYAFMLNISNQVLSVFVCIGVLMLSPTVFKLIGIKVEFFNVASEWLIYVLAKAKNIMVDGQMVTTYVWQTSEGINRCIISGIVTTVLFNVGGILCFSKRDIK